MYEELVLAVDELRQRPRNRAWFVPLVMPGGNIPDWSIGGGETLRDINYIAFEGGDASKVATELTRVLPQDIA